MLLLIVVLIILLIIMFLTLLHYRREIVRLTRQLDVIEDGSQIELSASVRSKEFMALYQKLETLLGTFRASRFRYEKSQKQLKKTISNIAHDIRTPLTSAAGYLQMLEECRDMDTQKRYISIVQSRLDELKEMLEELFLYTKLTNEDFVLECGPTPVYPVLCDAMVGLYHVFDEQGVEPEIQFDDESLLVLASPESLGRIFRNLINNALLHGAGGLCVVQKGDRITFSNPVENPSAIDPDQMFERFYKADSSRKKGSSGLGLAIVSELMRRMGGAVKAEIHGNFLDIELTFSLADKEV